MKVTKTPKPSAVSVEFVEPPPNSPSAISAMPITSSTVAMIVSRRETRPSVGAAASRSAAIGVTRVARNDGPSAETTATTVPTTSGTMIARDWMTMPLEGRSIPIAVNSALIPGASATPSAIPASDPSTPRISPSARTLRSTWRRVAPSAPQQPDLTACAARR